MLHQNGLIKIQCMASEMSMGWGCQFYCIYCCDSVHLDSHASAGHELVAAICSMYLAAAYINDPIAPMMRPAISHCDEECTGQSEYKTF
jgi:hypothetical protein